MEDGNIGLFVRESEFSKEGEEEDEEERRKGNDIRVS